MIMKPVTLAFAAAALLAPLSAGAQETTPASPPADPQQQMIADWNLSVNTGQSLSTALTHASASTRAAFVALTDSYEARLATVMQWLQEAQGKAKQK
jgi:hypothetical protein